MQNKEIGGKLTIHSVFITKHMKCHDDYGIPSLKFRNATVCTFTAPTHNDIILVASERDVSSKKNRNTFNKMSPSDMVL